MLCFQAKMGRQAAGARRHTADTGAGYRSGITSLNLV
jgi:hypothetical protein